MRSGKGVPENLKEWAVKPSQTPQVNQSQTFKSKRICIIGAGVSGNSILYTYIYLLGLTAAYELEKLGHQVTVLEKSNQIGGKCGSVEIKGKAYDVGGHFCSDVCTNIKEYIHTFNLTTENTTKSVSFDIDSKTILFPTIDMNKYKEEYKKYREITQNMPSFMYQNTLSEPVNEWFDKHNLHTIKSLISESYTSISAKFQ